MHVRPPPSEGRRRRAFTLAELLVVVGIIAVLAAILLPTLARAQREARKVSCKAQLQQVGYAFRMYMDQSNKGRYPRAPALPSVNPNNYPPIQDTLESFVNHDVRVFRCPADDTVYPAEGTSYFYYSELGETTVNQTFFWKVYQDVTKVPVLWDADHYHGGNLPFNWLFADGHVEHFLDGVEQKGAGK